jgi:hypothetical protein
MGIVWPRVFEECKVDVSSLPHSFHPHIGEGKSKIKVKGKYPLTTSRARKTIIAARHITLAELAKVFKSEAFCVLTFYADESYDANTFCVGGWLHSVDSWKDIESKWSQRIEYERRRSIKKNQIPISRFHAADCSTRHGEFEGWSVSRQKLFFRKLIGIICAHEPFGIAWSSSFEDLRTYFPHYKRKVAQRVLYLVCMVQCLRELSRIMGEQYPGERVTIIHDCGFNGVAQKAMEITKKKHDPGKSLLTIAPMEWRDCIALQPADLMAYEGSKVCFRHRNNIPEIRRSFQKILGADVPLSVGYLKESIFELAKKKGVSGTI